jgi:hypothetical protein
VKVTISISDDLAGKIHKMAAERGVSVPALISAHLEELVGEHARSADQGTQMEALERSSQDLRINMGKITWTREELHERPSSRAPKEERE